MPENKQERPSHLLITKTSTTELYTSPNSGRDTVLIQAWYKEIRSQEKVKRERQIVLNSDFPDSYDRELFSQKTRVIFQYFYNLAEQGAGTENYAH